MEFITVPPNRESNHLVVVWHMLDAPRTPVAMASALPLRDLDAWRVYLPLPMPAEADDPVMGFFHPIVEQAVTGFPAVLEEIRRQIPAADGPVKLVGASIGAMIVLRLLADSDTSADAAVLISPAVQLTRLVAANERAFGMAYPWSDESRAVAQRLDFVARAEELVKREVPILLVTGEEDDQDFRVPAEELWRSLSGLGSLVTVPGMAHALADEPGLEAAPQTPHAAKVDAIVSDWLERHSA